MNLVELPNGTFTKREVERLIVYRAAVAAGFYTDQDGSVDTVDTVDTVDSVAPEAQPGPLEAGATSEAPTR